MNNKLILAGKFEYADIYKYGSTLNGGVYIAKVTQSCKTKTVRVSNY